MWEILIPFCGQKTGWVLDADIKSFFDNIDHEWMMKCKKRDESKPETFDFLGFTHIFIRILSYADGTVRN